MFIGDVFGEAGRDIIVDRLFRLRHMEKVDFVIANCENASHGRGLSAEHAKELFESGIDFVTMGNHTFDRTDFVTFADRLPVVRPGNIEPDKAGKGFMVVNVKNAKVAVMNLEGAAFISPPGDNPFYAADGMLKSIGEDVKIKILDFHAEASGEKKALAVYLDGRVSAVLGTHTHVQTADEMILTHGTAYITDVGMTGVAQESIIGMDADHVIRKMKDNEHVPFIPANGMPEMDYVLLDIDEQTGKTITITRKREMTKNK